MKRYRKTKTLISRRALFSGAASAAFASNLPSGAIAAESGRIKLAAALRLDGKEAVFREADGIDRGVYVGEFVQQRSVEAKNPSYQPSRFISARTPTIRRARRLWSSSAGAGSGRGMRMM